MGDSLLGPIRKYWRSLAIGTGVLLVAGVSAAAGYFVATVRDSGTLEPREVVSAPAIEPSLGVAQSAKPSEMDAIDLGLAPVLAPLEMSVGAREDAGTAANAIAPPAIPADSVGNTSVEVSGAASKSNSEMEAAAVAETPAPAPWQDCETCPWMVSVPSGHYQMGDRSGAGQADERPVHRVEVPAFAIGRFEVTAAEWSSCVADRVCTVKTNSGSRAVANHPVTNVNRSDAMAYVRWLSKETGQVYRLPTEAEWEYAARAGTEQDYPFDGGADALCAYANGADASSKYDWRYRGCSDGVGASPAAVGTFKSNRFGLHDMIGNVWEWTADCWHAGYRNAPSNGEAWGEPCDEEAFVLRGGAFSVDASKLRVSYRYYFPDQRMPFFGMRVVRDVR